MPVNVGAAAGMPQNGMSGFESEDFGDSEHEQSNCKSTVLARIPVAGRTFAAG